VDWIVPPPLGTETELSIIVRVPLNVTGDACTVTIEATDNDENEPITLMEKIKINVIEQKF
jgi:hypothetical protein